MQELITFCNSIKSLIESHPQMDIKGARDVVRAINDYLYTTHDQIGSIECFETTFEYFSDFHRFWQNHYEEILGCTIDDSTCEQVADALHGVYAKTAGNAFKSVWDKCGLSDQDVCRVRFLTANQDFRGSRSFSELAQIFKIDNSIFDENDIKDNPQDFLRSINVGGLSQNDKRINYAKNIAGFLLSHECTPFDLINVYQSDIFSLRTKMIDCNAGYGNKKTDMFLRDMVVLGIWPNVTGFDKIDVASDVNTIKVALRTGIIKTEIPLVTSFLDIFCYQYGYIDEMNAKAWRRVWELWTHKYPADNISSPCLLDYFVYNVVGRQFCKEGLAIFRGDNCGHEFRWHSSQNRTCQTCVKLGLGRNPATVVNKVLPCSDTEGRIAILKTAYVESLPQNQKIDKCPFAGICADKKHLMPPKSISILGQTGWQSAYCKRGQGGGGLMA